MESVFKIKIQRYSCFSPHDGGSEVMNMGVSKESDVPKVLFMFQSPQWGSNSKGFGGQRIR